MCQTLLALSTPDGGSGVGSSGMRDYDINIMSNQETDGSVERKGTRSNYSGGCGTPSTQDPCILVIQGTTNTLEETKHLFPQAMWKLKLCPPPLERSCRSQTA